MAGATLLAFLPSARTAKFQMQTHTLRYVIVFLGISALRWYVQLRDATIQARMRLVQTDALNRVYLHGSRWARYIRVKLGGPQKICQ